MYMNSRLNTRHACLRTVTSSSQYVSSTRLLSKGSDFRLSYHARNCLLSLHRPHSHHNTRHRGRDLCSLGFPQYWNSDGTTIWRQSDRMPRAAYGEDTLSRKTKCSIFMHIIFSPFTISSGFHFSRIALFRMKWRSNALALCAIAIILLAQGRGSVKYVSMSPTGSSQNECFLLPHRTQSPSSTSSHREQNCCTQTRLGTCNLASSMYLAFRVVSKSQNTFSTLPPVEGNASFWGLL